MIEPNKAADAVRNVVVRDTGRGQFQQEIVWGPHRLIADEPTGVGGLDSGLGPYELLLASLGACTAMTLRLYADRKHLPLKSTALNARRSQECSITSSVSLRWKATSMTTNGHG